MFEYLKNKIKTIMGISSDEKSEDKPLNHPGNNNMSDNTKSDQKEVKEFNVSKTDSKEEVKKTDVAEEGKKEKEEKPLEPIISVKAPLKGALKKDGILKNKTVTSGKSVTFEDTNTVQESNEKEQDTIVEYALVTANSEERSKTTN